MNTTNTKTSEYIKTSKNGAIYFDPTCDDNNQNNLNKDYTTRVIDLPDGLKIKIKNGVNYFFE